MRYLHYSFTSCGSLTSALSTSKQDLACWTECAYNLINKIAASGATLQTTSYRH